MEEIVNGLFISSYYNITQQLIDEYKIQCGAYMSLYFMETGIKPPCKLFNTRTSELLEITVDDPQAYMEILMRGRS